MSNALKRARPVVEATVVSVALIVAGTLCSCSHCAL
jgi:hypothetical protein